MRLVARDAILFPFSYVCRGNVLNTTSAYSQDLARARSVGCYLVVFDVRRFVNNLGNLTHGFDTQDSFQS